MTPLELRAWRTSLDFTQREAAKHLGVHLNTYRSWELQRAKPRRSIDLRAQYLTENPPQPPPPPRWIPRKRTDPPLVPYRGFGKVLKPSIPDWSVIAIFREWNDHRERFTSRAMIVRAVDLDACRAIVEPIYFPMILVAAYDTDAGAVLETRVRHQYRFAHVTGPWYRWTKTFARRAAAAPDYAGSLLAGIIPPDPVDPPEMLLGPPFSYSK